MPDVKIQIGGREFDVACQEGEESYLQTAAMMLDEEAQVLSDQVGRLPEGRMLLMAGLMLADKAASFEEQAREMEQQITDRDAEWQKQVAQRDAEIERLRNQPPPEAERIEVPVVPVGLVEALTGIAEKAESAASDLERKTNSDK